MREVCAACLRGGFLPLASRAAVSCHPPLAQSIEKALPSFWPGGCILRRHERRYVARLRQRNRSRVCCDVEHASTEDVRSGGRICGPGIAVPRPARSNGGFRSREPAFVPAPRGAGTEPSHGSRDSRIQKGYRREEANSRGSYCLGAESESAGARFGPCADPISMVARGLQTWLGGAIRLPSSGNQRHRERWRGRPSLGWPKWRSGAGSGYSARQGFQRWSRNRAGMGCRQSALACERPPTESAQDHRTRTGLGGQPVAAGRWPTTAEPDHRLGRGVSHPARTGSWPRTEHHRAGRAGVADTSSAGNGGCSGQRNENRGGLCRPR